MGALTCRARVVAKIEKVEAYERLDEIIAVSDGIMVARGDYGVEAGVAHVPLMQKDTIARATQAGKLVITATQMLESMIHAPEPTRAEATDVANAVIDGSSAVMLSAETSVGSYPVEAVLAMAEIAEAAEHAPEIHGRARSLRPDTPAAAVMHAAVELAQEIDAVALVVPTASGGAPRACAKYRSKLPIIALAHDRRVADQITLDWGVYCYTMGVAESVDEHDRGRPDRGARRRRPADRRARGAHRRAADRHAGRHQPDHGARDPLNRPCAPGPKMARTGDARRRPRREAGGHDRCADGLQAGHPRDVGGGRLRAASRRSWPRSASGWSSASACGRATRCSTSPAAPATSRSPPRWPAPA